jgi:16S rRNA (guanine966-N2)-methyltransferase
VREAIFNILAHQVYGANIIELFAGTGALSIEALSRGAAQALMIDKSARCVAVIQRNIRVCNLEDRASVIQKDARQDLDRIAAGMPEFNLVFMDPPYGQGFIKPALINLHQSGKLAPNALIVVEHAPAESPTLEAYGFKLCDQRTYGKTLVSFLQYML